MFRVKSALSTFAGAALLAAGSAQAITFTVPGDAPNGAPGTWSVLDVRNNGGMGDQNNARTSLTSGGLRTVTSHTAINFLGSGGNGQFGGDAPFPQGDGDNIAILARATVYAPVAGNYTINVNSDDGFTVAINNGTTAFTAGTVYGGGTILDTYNGTANGALTFFGGRGTDNSGATVFLSQGAHQFDVTYHEGGGGSAFEISAATGSQAGFNSSFALLNDAPGIIKNVTPSFVGPVTLEASAINTLPAQNIASAKAHIAAVNGSTVQSSVINFKDPGNGVCCGGFDNGAMIAFPGASGDNFATQTTGTLFMPETGEVILHIKSDDGFSFQIDGAQWQIISSENLAFTSVANGGEELIHDNGTGNSNVVARLLLGQGNHSFALTHWDGGGGSYMQVFLGLTPGDTAGVLLGSVPASVTESFRLSLSDPSVPEPATAMLGMIGMGIMALRRRRMA